MDKQRAAQLFEKFSNNTLTEQERAELESWYVHYGSTQEGLRDPDVFQKNLAEMDSAFPFKKPARVKRLWVRIAAAASILLCCSVGLYFYRYHHSKPTETAQLSKNDIAPGSNKAILTLSGGQKIILNNAKTGQIALQGATKIKKTADGQVVYQAGENNNTTVTYNTMTTPRGGQHWVILADGSKVLLNAASSLTYPTAFNGKERKVTLTGEAYFEVMHNDKQPFIVLSNNQQVQDIGTHFNINAYGDEPATITTLIEGAVKVNNTLLKPGQQSILQGNAIDVKQADVEATLAWKNGLFIFDDEPLESIMRKVSRWYDVDITYDTADKNKAYWGSISRYDNVSKVLAELELTGGVHFSIEGRRIIARK